MVNLIELLNDVLMENSTKYANSYWLYSKPNQQAPERVKDLSYIKYWKIMRAPEIVNFLNSQEQVLNPSTQTPIKFNMDIIGMLINKEFVKPAGYWVDRNGKQVNLYKLGDFNKVIVRKRNDGRFDEPQKNVYIANEEIVNLINQFQSQVQTAKTVNQTKKQSKVDGKMLAANDDTNK